MTDGPRNIRREVLPNGLTVITEEMQHVRSISVGIWVKTGSRDEDAQENGISHFIEHMLFKGPSIAQPKTLRARWIRLGATWMPSRQRNASASPRRYWTSTVSSCNRRKREQEAGDISVTRIGAESSQR